MGRWGILEVDDVSGEPEMSEESVGEAVPGRMRALLSHMRRHKRQYITALLMIVFVVGFLPAVAVLGRGTSSILYGPLPYFFYDFRDRVFGLAIIVLITPYMFAYGFYPHRITLIMSVAGVLTWLLIGLRFAAMIHA